MGFRAKQIAALTLVAASVALATSLVNLASLARLTVSETESRARLLAETLYHQASRVIRQQQGPEEIRARLTSDDALRNYAEGVVGYSPTTMYVVITDREGFALVHSNPLQIGEKLEEVPSLDGFAAQNPFSQLLALRSGHQTLEIAMPFEVDEEPFGHVRVAVSTLLLREELAGAISRTVLIATGVVVAAFMASLVFAAWLLAPIEMLRRELGRIKTREGEPPLDLRNEADVNRIAEFFASMSEKLNDERSSRENGSSWLSTMLGGLSDAVVVVSDEGRVLSLNQPAEELLGKDRDELTGKTLSELLPAGHPVAETVARALADGNPVGPLNARIATDGKKEVVYALGAQVLRDDTGITGVMVSARDMEKLSRLGSHLSYSQKLAALGKLTSGVAHEIKNPLNAMVIHVALLREKLSRGSPEMQVSLDTLEREIRRLDQVVQGFLRFTRPEDLRLTSVPVRELVEQVERLVSAEAAASGIEIATCLQGDLPPVYGDRELLQQVLLNLVRNAEEAMPEGGRVSISAQAADEGLEIAVEDTGVGIEPEMLDRIFDLYVTTKSKGSGIGLSMVYRIVQLHAGEITVESEKGQGTRFSIHLPGVPG